MMQKIKVEDAVGLTLAHDHTQILPGKFKGARFRCGHIVRRADIAKLLDMGKKEVYVLSLRSWEVHEDDAANRMARAVAGRHIKIRPPREGKADFIANTFGMLKVAVGSLEKINRIGSIVLSTRHNRSIVRKGDIVAGTRIIPLFIRESKVAKVEDIGRRQGPVIEISPILPKKIGVLVTGSEIYEGRIEDRSVGIVTGKAEALGSKVVRTAVVTDDPGLIAAEIGRMKKAGCQVIVTTGGLSVDPDDVTLSGIRKSGAEVLFYGTPVLPGAMFVYAKLGRAVILGTPACVVHDPVTALDLFLPRVLSNDTVTAGDVAPLGHGGLCLHCPICRYPVCPFGKSG
jgi:hypothetical protein